MHKTRFLFFILLKTYNFFLPYHYQQFLLIISDRHLNSFPILILVFEQPMSSSSPLHPPFMLATESILPYWVEREPAAQTKQLPTPKYSVQTASGGPYSYCWAKQLPFPSKPSPTALAGEAAAQLWVRLQQPHFIQDDRVRFIAPNSTFSSHQVKSSRNGSYMDLISPFPCTDSPSSPWRLTYETIKLADKWSLITESPNSQGWKGPLEVVWSNPLLKQGLLEWVAHDFVQTVFEYFQG